MGPAGSDAPAGIVFRAARPSDLAGVLGLLAAAGLPEDGVSEGIGDAFVVATEAGSDGERLIGAAGVEEYGAAGLLRSAVVDPNRRGRSIGDQLTRNRIDWARVRGLQNLYLLTTTAESYFPRFGFARIERSDVPPEVRNSLEFCSACPSTATVMRLSLTD